MPLALLLLACTSGPVDTGEPVSSGAFSALSYNIHGLPPGITGDDTAGRLAQIAPLLEPFDVVGLQEEWMDANYPILVDGTTHPTRLRFDEKVDEEKVYGSGLAFFARFPHVLAHHEHYGSCNGTLDGASDCFASKGFQVVRLQLGAAELDVYNTHLEAGGGPDDEAARADHVEALVAAMDGLSAGRAVLFLGDTNLRPSDPADEPLLQRLLTGGGLSDTCAAVSCPEPDHIDRVLWRDGGGLSLVPTAWANEAAFFDAEGVPLSDHPAISASFGWAWAE